MAKNVRALTDEELQYFVDTYVCELQGDYIIVYSKYFNRKTLHSRFESFYISSKLRRITITTNAINLWIDEFKDKGFSLLEVQSAMNKLIVTYQDLSSEMISKELEQLRSLLNKGE